MKRRTVRIAVNGMLAAMAFVTYLLMPKIPIVPAVNHLSYDPKDIVIVIGGFILGPLSVIIVSVTASLIEWFTVSTTAHFGFIMNVISTCSFAGTASLLYKKTRKPIISLIAGVIVMSPVMMLSNYLIAPIYFGFPRSVITALLIPGYLPFNLIKGGINAAIALIVFIPLRKALSKYGFN